MTRLVSEVVGIHPPWGYPEPISTPILVVDSSIRRDMCVYKFWNMVAAVCGTVLMAAAFGLLVFAIDASPPRVWGLLALIVSAAVFAGLFRRGESVSDRAVTRALKRAELPPDAEPKVWNTLLERRQRQLRSSRTGAIVLLALLILAIGIDIAAFELSDLVIAALLVAYLGWAQHNLRTVGVLLASLDGVGAN